MAANFCRFRICRTLGIACSRRRKGGCEFSARLFAQRPRSCLSAMPISRYGRPIASKLVGHNLFGVPLLLQRFLHEF